LHMERAVHFGRAAHQGCDGRDCGVGLTCDRAAGPQIGPLEGVTLRSVSVGWHS
jgi:hypothetical protein